jgi:hypothetical protein
MKRPAEKQQQVNHEHKRNRSMHTKRHRDEADDFSRETSSALGSSDAWESAVYTTSATHMGPAVEEAPILDDTFQHMNSCSEAIPHAHAPARLDSSRRLRQGDALSGLRSMHVNASAGESPHIGGEQQHAYARATPSELWGASNTNTTSFHSKNTLQMRAHADDDCSGDAPTGPEQVNLHDGPAALPRSDSWPFVHTEPSCVTSDEGCFTAEPGTSYHGKRVAEESLKEKELLERLGDLKIRIAQNVRGERGSGKRCKTTEQSASSA